MQSINLDENLVEKKVGKDKKNAFLFCLNVFFLKFHSGLEKDWVADRQVTFYTQIIHVLELFVYLSHILHILHLIIIIFIILYPSFISLFY